MDEKPIKLYNHVQPLFGTHNFVVKHKFGPHIHEHFEFFYSISEKSKFYIDNRIYDIKSHDLFIIPPKKVHMRISHYGEKFERYILDVHPQFLKPINGSGTDMESILTNACENKTHKLHLDEQQHQKFAVLLEKFFSGKDILQYTAAMEIAFFACELIEGNCEHQNSDKIEESKINTIIKFIENNLAGDLSPTNIAKSLGMKQRTISTIFKSTTNTTVYNYIINRRITEAKKLLIEQVPVTKVCEMVGFHNYCHFSETFTKTVGMSPKRFASQFNKTS